MEIFITSIVSYVQGLAVTSPKLLAFIAIAYMVGFVAKIIRSSVEAFVLESPSKDDDLKLAKVEASPIAKAAFFLIDLLIRFKKPETK
jgi:hypothetical protein